MRFDSRLVTMSVVMPAYDEQAGIADAIRHVSVCLAELDVADYEIVVIDDGSRDATYAAILAAAARDRHVRAIRLSRNFGKEGALVAGLSETCGNVVVTMDADLQHPPELLRELLSAWCDGSQIVHAVKRDRHLESRLARIRSAAFNRAFTWLCQIDLSSASDYKLLDRVVVNILLDDVTERERFYRGLASWVGFEQTLVEFDVSARTHGTTHWSLRSLADLALTATVSFTSAPLRIVTGLGVVTLVFAFVLTVVTLASWLNGTAVSGFSTIIVTLLMIGSFIMISLGIVGEYIARIYLETKGRPIFIVARRDGFPNSGDERSRSVAQDDQRLPSGRSKKRALTNS